MGQGASKDEEARLNANINKRNKSDHEDDQNQIKFLLLGTGESGKSALFKQIKALYGVADSNTQWKGIIERNIIEFAQVLVAECLQTGVPLDDTARALGELTNENSSLFAPLSPSDQSLSVGMAIKALWNDPQVRNVFSQRRPEMQINEPHVIFMNKIDEILLPTYVPDQADIILARVRTTGIHSDKILVDGKPFCLYDVGGQRNERRKWIHVFDNVNGIVFVVGLGDFNLRCFEDTSKNRMADALELFKSIAGEPSFKETPIVLFLNKADLFETKVATIPINSVPEFSDGPSGGDFVEGYTYFQNRFVAQAKGQELFVHVTVATNPANIRTVFQAARHSVVTANMKRSGIY